MSVIVRLQNLPWSAVAADIRQFFAGLSIPEGGVNIVGGELGDAFIAFSTDEDARLAMQRDGGKVKDCKVKLLLSSRTEMQRETARQQSLQMQQYMQMQQMQPQATPQQPSPAAAVPQPAAAVPPTFPMQQQQQQQQQQPVFTMQQPALPNNLGAPAVTNLQPLIPNVQQNMFGQPEPGAQPPPSMTPMPGMQPMQFQQMPPFSMATPLSANSIITSIPQAADLSAPSTPLQVRNQPNMQQLPPGQMPFQTASPQMNQTYQMQMPQVNQSPVSQAITPHVPVMQTTGHHMAQQPNFQPQQQMNIPPNFQQPLQQMPPPGFQTQLMNQPPPFQAAGAPRMTQPQQFPPPNPQANQNMPFQPAFPPNANAPPFQMANQQGSPAPSFQSPSPQVAQAQSSQNFPNSRLPPTQRKPDNNSDSNKNERAKRSRSKSPKGSPGSRSQSREHSNRGDMHSEKDRRRRNSRDHKQQRGRRDRSRSRERRSSRDTRRDDDSRWGRRSDNKRSTDPKQLYRDYENPNNSFKPSVVPASRSKTDANSNSKKSNSTTASSNLDTQTTSSKAIEKSENKQSDTKSITTTPNYSDRSSQQNDQMNKIESSPNNKDVSSSGLPNSIDNEVVSTTNLSLNSPFKTSNSNKTSHAGEEYKYGTSSSKRKAPNDEYNQDNAHYRNKADRNEGGRGARRRRGFDEAPARFGDERHSRMNPDEIANEPNSGFRNERFNRFNSQFNEPISFDYSQPPSFGWENETIPNVNCCVVLQNFPIFNGPKDVIDFFHDLTPNMTIKLQRNESGHLNTALIRFANYEDKLKGLRRNGFKLKKSVVTVRHISDREFDNADDALFPQKEGNKLVRSQEKVLFHVDLNLRSYQCLCLEGDRCVDPVFDSENVYHEGIRVVFNQINPVELFIHYGVCFNRAFVRFENYAKANSAKNLFTGLIVENFPIITYPCSDEQFEKFKEIVEKEESNKKPDNLKKEKFEPNKRHRMNRRPMFPDPASFTNSFDQSKNADPRMGNRKERRAPNSFSDDISEMDDFYNPVENFNQRTLLPNPPMHSSPKRNVLKSCCLIMQGLPLNVHYQDIVKFFSFVSIQPKQIHVMVVNGSPTGDAFCEFNTVEEADIAVKRNNCQLDMNFVHVRLVTQDELDRAVGKSLKPPQPPHLLVNNPNINQPGFGPPHLPPPIGGPGAPPPAQFGQPPPFGGRDAFNMGRGRGKFPMMPRGRGRGGFESGGRGGFEGGARGGRGGFESGGRGRFEGGTQGGRGGFEGAVREGRGGLENGGRGGRGGFEGDDRGGRGRFEGGDRGGRGELEGGDRGGRGEFEGGGRGGRGGFEGGGRGGRGGFEGGGRGGRGGFEGGGRGGRGGFEGGGHGGRGEFERGRGGERTFEPPAADSPSTHDNNDMNENDLLPESKVASFGKPDCVVAATNIPFRADVTDIIEFFKHYNLVTENVIRRYNDFGQATGDARIAFETPDDAKEAIRLYSGTQLQNRTIRLELVR